MRSVGAVIFLLGLWLLLSGIYTPMIIGFGVASALTVVFVNRRMDAVDNDRLDVRLKPIEFVKYFGWLLVEIAKANWAVTKIILSPKMPINQHLFTIPHSQKTDLGQVIFANSITLTPGTISVETEAGEFLVHAVDYGDEDMAALADMEHRVCAVENVGGV